MVTFQFKTEEIQTAPDTFICSVLFVYSNKVEELFPKLVVVVPNGLTLKQEIMKIAMLNDANQPPVPEIIVGINYDAETGEPIP